MTGPRDPNKTARNKYIASLDDEIDILLPRVLPELARNFNQLSLNAYIGSKAGDFIDLKNKVMRTPAEYLNEWILGMRRYKEEKHGYCEIESDLANQAHVNFRKYVCKFLERSYLKRYDHFNKERPEADRSSYWFGQNDSYYGLFITPRYKNGQWENDKSEIRAFAQKYWTIGHALETGVCFPGEDRRQKFNDLDDLFNFFYAQIKLTKSKYQIDLAREYEKYVRGIPDFKSVPLLIPEVRYKEGQEHEHRLDFLIVNPFTMSQLGIELSPWSTHGQLSGKHKTLIELNTEARGNWEKEVTKMNKYYRKFNIYTIHFTDQDLLDIPKLFNSIIQYLDPGTPPAQMQYLLFNQYFN